MPLSIVIGGQFGGEGKGTVVAALNKWHNFDVLVKGGGPNSSHSYGEQGNIRRVRMIPCGTEFGASYIVFPAGCLIYPKLLFKEIEEVGFKGEVIIDDNAGIIEECQIENQSKDPFYDTAGSTRTGTGMACSYRALRRLKIAKDEILLRNYTGNTREFILSSLKKGKKILIEGGQGYGLSNYHGLYPYVTSRDTTVNEFMSQLGLGPKFLTETIMAIKCLPTRNKNGLGVLQNELNDDFINNHFSTLSEYGGGSYNGGDILRRVALFDFKLLRDATTANTPDYLALTGLDKLEYLINESELIKEYYVSIESFKKRIETEINIPIIFEGWGPCIENAVNCRQINLK